jgi:hypothetical protein
MTDFESRCFSCRFMRRITSSSHIRCANPDLTLTGDEDAIEKGYFQYPYNFNPIWIKSICKKFKEKI